MLRFGSSMREGEIFRSQSDRAACGPEKQAGEAGGNGDSEIEYTDDKETGGDDGLEISDAKGGGEVVIVVSDDEVEMVFDEAEEGASSRQGGFWRTLSMRKWCPKSSMFLLSEFGGSTIRCANQQQGSTSFFFDFYFQER